MKRAALLLLGIALPALGDRFNVTFEGKSVSRAQVCASRAGDLASPMTRFFTGTATICFPAADQVQLPPGTWNVFARRGAELISDSVVVAMGGGTNTHDLALVAAASVEHDDAPLYAYVPATGAVIPVTDIVPATRIVPLIVKAGRVLAIGAPVTPKATKINRFEFPEEKGSVIVPVTLEGKGEPPQVALAGTAQRADSSLLFFRNVPTGIQMIELRGDPWMATHRPVNVNAGAIAVAEPLVARVVTTLRVHWSRGKVGPNDRDCDGKPANPLPLTLTLLACSDEAASRCGSIIITRQLPRIITRQLPRDAQNGVIEFPNLTAGTYLLRAAELQKEVRVAADKPNDVEFEIRYATFFGRVTRGGKPLHVRLFETATDPDTGDYTAALPALPKAGAVVTLVPCDGGGAMKIVPDEEPADNARFDIEVPDNRLAIHVIDAESRAPIEKAFVSLAALENGHDQAAHFAGPAGMTDAEGRLVIESAVANKRLHICAWRSDYENACSDRFELGSETEKNVELALSRSSARQGRVVLNGPQQVASVAWYSPDGRTTEITQVREDGTFTYQRAHAPGEIVAYFSVNQPFMVMRQPRVADDDVFEIRPPFGARVRRFQVGLASSAHEGAFVALAIGDIMVPEDALRWHMSRHGDPTTVPPGGSTQVIDIVESAPIRVILIPYSFVNSHDVRGVDPAMQPEVNALPQQALGERARVDFP